MTSTYRREVPKAWGDDVALAGPDAPKNDGSIKHLIEYLLTVYERFGNTRVTSKGIQWGASALWKADEQAKRIEELEAKLAAPTEVVPTITPVDITNLGDKAAWLSINGEKVYIAPGDKYRAPVSPQRTTDEDQAFTGHCPTCGQAYKP